jgi:cytochrome c oxidase subunit 3
MSELVSRLQPHFRTEEQQYETAQFGMWVFLVTEVMFFGGLFTAYLIYRIQFPEAWANGSHHLDILWGCFNTVVLIGSSLTMAPFTRRG